MTFVAILFLVMVALRVMAMFVDNGFGGPVWTAIVYVSSVAWLLGAVMALSIILDIRIGVGL